MAKQRSLVWVLICIGIMASGFAVHKVIGWDSRYEPEKLIGLSESQVLATFGVPDYYNRDVGLASPPEIPVAIAYHGPLGQTYVITFVDGKVTDVRRLRK